MTENNAADNHENPPRSELMKVMDRPWAIILLLLHVGFLGIPIYWKTNYSVGTRVWISLASIVYTVAAVAFIFFTLRWIFQVLASFSA
ncbi:hypothetical protein N9D23_11055 [Rubripirellula sp.]|nr:hypothetical protein [Planctomycetaceae bacterium]MDA9858646.1 hypothetical protein [Rubripirellula sp.]MDF1845290.1 hypothetical protein [Rubripirellula sp.]